MCGIVGYVGNKQVVPVILDGLRKLEYRGYDSAGIAVVDEQGALTIRRAEGKLRNLEEAIRLKPLDGTYGIGHTRWATHGRPTEENAHPHRDCTGKIVVVHNGIIENFLPLKHQLQSEDHVFVTETDTEVIAHLIEKYLKASDGHLEAAVRGTVPGRVSQTTGRVYLDEMEISEAEFRQFTSIKAIACGTSLHAAMAGKYMLEELARIPVEIDYASEFRYRDPILDDKTLVIAISQSGETADTIAAVRESKEKGAKILSICNVQGSMLTRESHGTVLTHAGPEIGVASTKAFTSQMTVLYLLALYLGQQRGVLSEVESLEHVRALNGLPVKMETLLGCDDQADRLAREFHRAQDFLYLGRGINFPLALEGALKLKEISYIHAEGYPAGEMKHGPNALIDEDLPVVV